MDASFSKTNKIIIVCLLFAEAISVTVPVIVLGKYFNFPDILRQPAEQAFTLFRNNESLIVAAYYIFLLSSLFYMPISYTACRFYNQSVSKFWLKALTGFGIATTVFQSIGFIRWIFTMPFLTESYFSHGEEKQVITLLYEMLNRYAGMSVGEHLGFIAMGCWTTIFGIILIKKQNPQKWLGYTGCLTGLLLIISVGEHFGGQTAHLFSTINFIANTLWTLWILAVAVTTTFLKNNFLPGRTSKENIETNFVH